MKEYIELETDNEYILDSDKIAQHLKNEVDIIIRSICEETKEHHEKAVLFDTPQVMYNLYQLLIMEDMQAD